MKKLTSREQILPPEADYIIELLTERSAVTPEFKSYAFFHEKDGWVCELRKPYFIPENYKQKKLQELIQFINENYMKKIEEEQAANLVGLSISEFCRFFKRQTGITLVAYINKVRIKQAARLLIETNLTCESIGYDCGFPTRSYFYKVFKSHCGLSPTKYRRQ